MFGKLIDFLVIIKKHKDKTALFLQADLMAEVPAQVRWAWVRISRQRKILLPRNLNKTPLSSVLIINYGEKSDSLPYLVEHLFGVAGRDAESGALLGHFCRRKANADGGDVAL